MGRRPWFRTYARREKLRRLTNASIWLAPTVIAGAAVYRRNGLGVLILALLLMPVMFFAVRGWIRRKERQRNAKS